MENNKFLESLEEIFVGIEELNKGNFDLSKDSSIDKYLRVKQLLEEASNIIKEKE